MRRVAFAVPGDLATPTGGYAYDRRMIAEIRQLGWHIDVIDLGEGFPRPSASTRKIAAARLAALPADCPVVIDGLAFGVLPDEAAGLRSLHPLIALVHHPLALEPGLSVAEAGILRASERGALAAAHHVVVTSNATGRLLTADYDVAAGHISVACPGSDRVPAANGSRDGTIRLLSVGAIVRRKGFDVLIEALAAVKNMPWQLTIVGDRSRDPETAARLDADIAQHSLGPRIAVSGSVTDKQLAALYAGADLFVLASWFEGYGMAYAEAIAHGLPVIGTTAGAIPETVPAGARILVTPGDSAALAAALRRLIENKDERRCMATAARAAAVQLPTWQDSAKLFSRALEALA